MDTNWKKVKRSGNFRRKVHLRLQKILEESKSQTTGNKSITEQSSSTRETPVNKTDEISEEVIVNADFEDALHNWNIELKEENFPEIGAEQQLSSELLDESINLRNKFREWATTYGISHIALKGLLHIWNYHLPNKLLPSDPRTLLKTPRNIILQNVGINGNYWHQGLELCLKKCLANVKDIPQTISININIDGLPIYKGSRKEFWPILFNIYELPRIKPMVIGIYYGYGKPSDINKFLQPFVFLKIFIGYVTCLYSNNTTMKSKQFLLNSYLYSNNTATEESRVLLDEITNGGAAMQKFKNSMPTYYTNRQEQQK